jgi:DNA-nicking Smr family endonuclease
VLKTFVAQYLKTLRVVKAYCSAQLQDGGNGALYVLIKA